MRTPTMNLGVYVGGGIAPRTATNKNENKVGDDRTKPPSYRISDFDPPSVVDLL